MKQIKKCPICLKEIGESHDILCSECFYKYIENPLKARCLKCGRTGNITENGICDLCKKVKPEFDMGISIFPYAGEMKDALKAIKYYNEFYRIRNFSQIMASYIKKMNWDIDLVLYVPSDIKTQYKRRYTLSQELAYVVSKELNLKIPMRYFIKKFWKKRQSTIEFNKRYTNMKDAFLKNPLSFTNVEGKNVLLVDDVMTTGSTLSECSRILKKEKVKNVYVASLTYSVSGV